MGLPPLTPGATDTAQPVDGSGSHGWTAVALLWLHRSLLGVTVAAPGGTELRIQPARGTLPYVCGTTATPRGLVQVSWNKTPLHVSVTLPSGAAPLPRQPRLIPAAADVTATLLPPVECVNSDGSLSLLSGPAAGAARLPNGAFSLQKPGTYTFECK